MVRRLLVVSLVLLVWAPPVHAQRSERPSIEDVPRPIVELLQDHSRAWREKDASLLTPTLAPGLQEHERKALENAKDVRFTSFDIEASTQYSGNLASKRIRDQYKEKDVATYHVVERSRIGNESETYEEDGAFTFVRSGDGGAYDGWRLTSKKDLDVLGFFSPYHLWDEKPVTVLESERFQILTHAEVADSMRPVLDIAERSMDRVKRFWPHAGDDRYVILVPSTTEELGRIMHDTVDLNKFVAFVAAGADRDEGWEPTGPRMFVHLSHLRAYGADAQAEIVSHELVHAVTRRTAGPATPAWVEEGVANFGGGSGGRSSRALEGPTPDIFPSDDRFITGPVQGIQAVYDQAQVAIEVLDEKFGRDGLVAFYEELGSSRVVPGQDEYHVCRAVAASVNWTCDEWIAAWRQRLS